MKTILLSLAFLFVVGTGVRAQKGVKHDGFPVQTTVSTGTLEGIHSTISGIDHYLGIPFAAPPVGQLRWRPPMPVRGWEGVREAKTFGPRAVQKFLFSDMRFRSEMSEDCLYLNVWTSGKSGETTLPILLYFHGGGNVAGSGDELRYDGEELAKQGIIVVTANYRLGAFGFLPHSFLSEESGGGSGNYGLMDQAAALAWVYENAAAFGGDPSRITIGGESAGSMDCSLLMASPTSRDKIAGVFAQSGAALVGRLAPSPLTEAEKVGEAFVKSLGASTLEGLRAASTQAIYEAQYQEEGTIGFPEVIDGDFLPKAPRKIYEAGDQASVPLMIGWTSTEVAWLPPPASAKAYVDNVKQEFDEATAAEILRLYPEKDYARSFVALASDRWIVHNTWKWADLHLQTGKAPVYRWQFDRIRPALKGETRAQEPLGAGHATDIEYFFNTLAKSDAYAWEPADHAAAQDMSRYLVNFVKTGNPNGEGLPEWANVQAGQPHPVMHLKEKSEVRTAENDARYKFLDKLEK